MANFDYHRFFNLSIDMLCIASHEGFFLDINDSFSEVLGYEKKCLLSQPFLKLIHPDDIQKTEDEMVNLKRGGKTIHFENRYKHIDGHYLTLSWSAKADTESGEIFAIARDVTEKRNQENRLKQIETALSSSSILAETDPKGVIVSVNDKFCEISGYTWEELIGSTHSIVNSGVHERTFFSDMWKTIAAKRVWSGIVANKKKNGDFYYVQTIITPILDHEDNITSFLAVRQDITESINIETELARTLSILNETNAIAKVGGWELEVATGELTWTDETFNILEVEKRHDQKPILPEGIELFTPEHKPIIEEAVSRAIEHGEPYSLELKALTAKGKVLWVYTNGRANYRDGQVVTLSGTIQDIDKRKQAELKYNLEKQKSIQSAKLASLGELAASMAHEINNPLGVISGYTELLQMSDEQSPEDLEKLDAILKSCDRISHIVGNLKKFSRKEDISIHRVHSLNEIISESISLARPRLKRDIVDLKFNELVTGSIKCEPIEIEQVFLNLINNSIDAVKDFDERSIEITVVDTDDSIECHVVDSGHGISESMKDNIFEPFYTSKKAGLGTGLGLSIVSDILEGHGAKIKYDAGHQNTCFVLTFPKAAE